MVRVPRAGPGLRVALLLAALAAGQPSASWAQRAPAGRIVVGEPVAEGEFGAVVALMRKVGAGDGAWESFCTGTLISDDGCVVTAAHCMEDTFAWSYAEGEPSVGSYPRNYHVMLGANLPRVGSCPVPETSYEWIGFEKSDIMIHPNYFKYNSKSLNIDPAGKIPLLDTTGDLAVVKLKTPPATQPAAVNFNGRDVRERIRQQQTATVAGWGRARNFPPFTTGTDLQLQHWGGPCTMQKAEIPLVSQVTCTEVGYFDCNCDEYICTSTPDRDPPYPFDNPPPEVLPEPVPQICFGDSGGPLFDADGKLMGANEAVDALVHNGNLTFCGFGGPSRSTRLADPMYRSWLRELKGRGHCNIAGISPKEPKDTAPTFLLYVGPYTDVFTTWTSAPRLAFQWRCDGDGREFKKMVLKKNLEVRQATPADWSETPEVSSRLAWQQPVFRCTKLIVKLNPFQLCRGATRCASNADKLCLFRPLDQDTAEEIVLKCPAAWRKPKKRRTRLDFSLPPASWPPASKPWTEYVLDLPRGSDWGYATVKLDLDIPPRGPGGAFLGIRWDA